MPGRALTLLSLIVFGAPFAHGDTAQVERVFLERTAIAAADAACNLFTEPERLALKSGLYQAEGELLRADYAPSKLASLTGQVRAQAKALGCDHPDVMKVAGTIRSSYRQFAKTNYLEYPAANSVWGASRYEHDKWAVMQTDKASGAIFGLRRGKTFEEVRLAVAIPANGRAPSAAKLILRDADKMREPWMGSLFGTAALATQPPRAVTRVEWAGDAEISENSVGEPFYVFFFSPTALDRVQKLDPRETVHFEFTPSPMARDKTAVSVSFEIGDLRAAHAFALIPKPAPSSLAAAPAAVEKSGH
jgi:hypothetical protein